MTGLGKLESGAYPIRRAYDFYSIQVMVARAMHQPAASLGAAAMMASVSSASGMRMYQMISELQRAAYLAELSRASEAQQAYASAQSLYRELAGTPDADNYWRTAQPRWLEFQGNQQELARMLAAALSAGGSASAYYDRSLVESLCRLALKRRDFAQVERVAQSFLNSAAYAAATQTSAESYRPEIQSVAESLTEAQMEQGLYDEALRTWLRFLRLDERLMGGVDSGESTPLPSQTGDLTVARLGDRTALWFQKDGHLRFAWSQDSYPQIESRVRRIRALCNVPSSDPSAIKKEAANLRRQLLPGGTDGASEVLIAVRGELAALPLALFSWASEGNPAEYSYRMRGSSADLSARTLDSVSMIFPGPNPNVNVTPLSADAVKAELDGVRHAFRATHLITGDHATAKELEAALERPGVVHFAGHAIPWRNSVGLVLAPDPADSSSEARLGIWSMTRPRTVRAGLVVFSACSTGVYADPATVAPGQLTEAALLAGAREALASLWDVDSAATSRWMAQFYSALSAGMPVVSAAAKAGSSVRAEPQWSHPHYWAPFVVYGS
jgi:tetratricopeptide (TPR) repeat protein